MIAADQNLGYQQNLKDRRLAIVVLDTNHWKNIQAASELVAAAINKVVPGSFTVVEVAYPRFRLQAA